MATMFTLVVNCLDAGRAWATRSRLGCMGLHCTYIYIHLLISYIHTPHPRTYLFNKYIHECICNTPQHIYIYIHLQYHFNALMTACLLFHQSTNECVCVSFAFVHVLKRDQMRSRSTDMHLWRPRLFRDSLDLRKQIYFWLIQNKRTEMPLHGEHSSEIKSLHTPVRLTKRLDVFLITQYKKWRKR